MVIQNLQTYFCPVRCSVQCNKSVYITLNTQKSKLTSRIECLWLRCIHIVLVEKLLLATFSDRASLLWCSFR